MTRCHSVLRNENSKRLIRPISALLAICTLFGMGGMTCLAQASLQEYQSHLITRAGFTADDLSALGRGETVIKLLPVSDKREVAVCGVVRLRATPDVIVKAFQQSMVQQNDKSILATGRFTDSPALADVATLSLEDSDIEDLKRCTIGICQLKISAAMIERFQRDVDWAAADYRSQATLLFRQILVDYVRDYRARGDAALIEYHDQRQPVSVRREQQEFFDRILYINDFTPAVASYLKNFPNSELPNVENSINWTKFKFGLKPVIIVTHVATYRRSKDNAQQILSVSKQIYANHYFDSSLALTAVINFSKEAGVSDSYLLYTNHSRADSLAGSFSRVKRGVVESESIRNLNDLLLQTSTNVEVRVANHSGSTPVVPNNSIPDWLFRGKRLYAWLLVATALVFLILLSRRNKRRMHDRSGDSTRFDSSL